MSKLFAFILLAGFVWTSTETFYAVTMGEILENSGELCDTTSNPPLLPTKWL